MYYEVHGAGEPLLLIHGGFGAVELWDGIVPSLAQHFRVVTFDCRGRGRTSDSAAPISYGRMVGDTVRLLDHLGIDRAHTAGHSDGAIICIGLLIDYPDRLRSAVLTGALFNVDQYSQESVVQLKERVAALSDSADAPRPWLGYEDRTPDRARFKTVLQKLLETWLVQPQYTPPILGTIRLPVLVIKAGHDPFVSEAASDLLAVCIPNSELLEFPDATHGLPRTHAAPLAQAIREFAERH